jgi:DNA-binding transcriptional LysR family regulator
VAVEGALIVSDRDIGVRAALCGLGIAYWVRHMMSPLIEQGRLVPLLEAYSPPLPGWHLYYPKQRHMPVVVRAFIDFVRKTRTPDETIGVARELQVF